MVFGLLILAAVGGVIALAAQGFAEPDLQLVYYTAQPNDLNITVTERGALESQDNMEVLCEADDVDNDGIRGVAIKWIIGNGENVKKGDLIVEFNDSSHRERLDRQILATEKARSDQIQAKAKYDNQITQNKTTLENAELKVKLADLDLKMYTDPSSGTHKLALEAIERKIDETNNEILQAQGNMELANNDKSGAEELFKLGYVGRSEVERLRIDYLRAESTYAAKKNALRTQLSELNKTRTYERQMQTLTLNGAVATAGRERNQVQRDNEALLDQAEAAMNAADESLKKEEERLARYKEKMEKCKIYAPSEGMVTYAVADSRRFWLEEIREGSTVRERQHILSIPNLSTMQVKTSVHESMLKQVVKGVPATIRIEADADISYPGRVKQIAVLADRQSSDVRVYQTIVAIDGEVENLKPGMTAVVDIHVAKLKNVLSVPVQAIVQVKDDSWVYVKAGRGAEQRSVKLGRTNDKFVEIIEGVKQGEQVVLNPMAIIDAEQKESELDGVEGAEEEPESSSDLPAEEQQPEATSKGPTSKALKAKAPQAKAAQKKSST